ncbi:penicillin-binding protein activator [Solemya velum gill symbiont]|uniref:penicillin-binding protein activator n=1 Tax=Solemya velum gill symbiont TaxID=2340 RepID=UPI0015C342C7|nr:penicillin-binding protein activator [Solemya velum gill symbiont]
MLSPIKLLLAATIVVTTLSACGGRGIRTDAPLRTAATSAPGASTRIAVMLPMSGKYGRVSAAIRNGMELVNSRRSPSQRPMLEFIDSGNDLSDALLSTTTGADIMVGPLSRENVDQVMRETTSLPRTVITLNQVSDISPYGVFQFGLSPDEDGRQIANKAFADGYRTASILYPETTWGSRYLAGFSKHWERLGGVTATIAAYPLPGETVTDSQEKKTNRERLTDAVKSVLENSGDFVYVVGKPAKARELRTFLLYYGNFDLPVYISARGYDRRLFAHNTADLRNAWMPAMPINIPDERPEPASATQGEADTTAQDAETAATEALAIQPQSNEPDWAMLTASASQSSGYQSDIISSAVPGWNDIASMPGFDSNYAAYYAMGIDAMILALNSWQLSPDRTIRGSTGLLFSDQDGIIRRHPAWIYYDKDQIKVQPPTVH